MSGRLVAYCHPDVLCKVFPKWIDELSAEACSTKINSLVAQAEAQRLAKLIKGNEANVAHKVQAKISGQVLKATLTNDFDNDDFPDFKKGRGSGPLYDDLTPD